MNDFVAVSSTFYLSLPWNDRSFLWFCIVEDRVPEVNYLISYIGYRDVEIVYKSDVHAQFPTSHGILTYDHTINAFVHYNQ